ncbi:uncharacterized protein LOC125047570 [Penaeus chinensis]|uniref:uncharacterized protein LOC125047570 n=1 Tax=Penaeus chinensis TaxID=139456 RepID=UPI001FB726FE|nr:uncharacterized protein LOC125047570 [Penaeus chinensis]
MRVHDPDRPPPSLPLVTHSKLSSFVITEAEVSSHTFHRCARQLAAPLASLFQRCLRSQRSASDLLLHLTTIWHQALDTRKDTFVVELDIAFDRLWHKGFASKLKSFGIDGNLLMLLEDYTQERTLRVFVNGHTSREFPFQASVPQGSLIPEAFAYADDCTLTFTCDTQNRTDAVRHINDTLDYIIYWGKRWQVTLAPDKTQAMIISRRQTPDNALGSIIKLNNEAVSISKNINILGVQTDNHLNLHLLSSKS